MENFIQKIQSSVFTARKVTEVVCFQEKSVRATEKQLKIAKELSDLIVYCQPVNFEWDNGILPLYCFF